MEASQRVTSSRPDRSDLDLLARALVLSLAFHLLVYGGHKAEQRYHWLEKIPVPAWLKRMQQGLVKSHPIAQVPTPVEQEVPLMFIEVNPASAVAEAPKKAKYYSSRNSRAANPDASVDANSPKISGNQTHVPKTETVTRTQPAAPPAPPAPATAEPNPEPEAKPKPKLTPGDLAFAKPTQQLRPTEGQAEEEKPRPKPRTIAEAQARQAANLMPGEKLKQEGGVRPRALQSTLDATATPFGEYDAAIIAAIQNRWYMLIDGQPLTRATGKVVLQFRLNYDGSVSDMQVLATTVSGLLAAMCQRAVIDPAPYGVWPSDMRRMIGANFRDVTFTFYYY